VILTEAAESTQGCGGVLERIMRGEEAVEEPNGKIARGEPDSGLTRAVSRRQFLRMASVAGATIGLTGALGSVATACGGSDATTTTSGPSAADSPATTSGASSTAASEGTSASASAEAGRVIKVGYVVPVTGYMAAFGTAAKWASELFGNAVSGGIVLGDNKKHEVQLVLRDAQSDSNRAAQVTGDLIQNDKVDLVISMGGPDVVNPSADTAEAMGCPSLSSYSEWHAFTLGRNAPAEGFKWTYLMGWASDGNGAAFALTCKQVPSNNIVGLIFANDADGQSWAQWAPTVFEQVGGFRVVTTDLYQPGTEDYTAQISAFKKAGCELFGGGMVAPDFTNFWKQALQQSFHPKVVCISKALVMPAAVEALGEIGYNLCGEGGWGPRSKYADTLTGMTSQEITDSYEAATGRMYDESASQIFLFSWAVDVLTRAANPDDKESIVAAVKTTQMSTLYGPLDFTIPVADQSSHPHVNCCTIPATVAQWKKTSGGKWSLDKVLVFSASPDVFAVEGQIEPLQYN